MNERIFYEILLAKYIANSSSVNFFYMFIFVDTFISTRYCKFCLTDNRILICNPYLLLCIYVRVHIKILFIIESPTVRFLV